MKQKLPQNGQIPATLFTIFFLQKLIRFIATKKNGYPLEVHHGICIDVGEFGAWFGLHVWYKGDTASKIYSHRVLLNNQARIRVKSPLFCCFFYLTKMCRLFLCWGGMLKVGKPEKLDFWVVFCEIGFQFAFKICLVSIKRREYLQSIPKNVSWYPKQLGLNGCLVKQPFPK